MFRYNASVRGGGMPPLMLTVESMSPSLQQAIEGVYAAFMGWPDGSANKRLDRLAKDRLLRHPRFYDQVFTEWSAPVILLLFAASCAGWRFNRRLLWERGGRRDATSSGLRLVE